MPKSTRNLLRVLLATFLLFWLYTLLYTNDLTNWIIENTLTILSLAFLIFSYRKYTFSNVSYAMIFLFLCLHVYGSQFTYAENPMGYAMKDFFGWDRNHYDRIVHFAFGFLLAYPLQEMHVSWLKFPQTQARLLPVLFALSVGALYEILEWGVAGIFFPEQGPAYLGLQGDPWDPQKDIFLGALGALLATVMIGLIRIFFRKLPNH